MKYVKWGRDQLERVHDLSFPTPAPRVSHGQRGGSDKSRTRSSWSLPHLAGLVGVDESSSHPPVLRKPEEVK